MQGVDVALLFSRVPLLCSPVHRDKGADGDSGGRLARKKAAYTLHLAARRPPR